MEVLVARKLVMQLLRQYCKQLELIFLLTKRFTAQCLTLVFHLCWFADCFNTFGCLFQAYVHSYATQVELLLAYLVSLVGFYSDLTKYIKWNMITYTLVWYSSSILTKFPTNYVVIFCDRWWMALIFFSKLSVLMARLFMCVLIEVLTENIPFTASRRARPLKTMFRIFKLASSYFKQNTKIYRMHSFAQNNCYSCTFYEFLGNNV